MFATFQAGRETTLEATIPRRRNAACKACRAKKIRCDGGVPCSNCKDRRIDCISIKGSVRGVEDSRPRRNAKSKSSVAMSAPTAESAGLSPPLAQVSPQPNNTVAFDPPTDSSDGLLQPSHATGSTASPLDSGAKPPVLDEIATQRDETGHEVVLDRQEGPISAASSNFEYEGPRGMLAICSFPAVRWVSMTIGDDSYETEAAEFLKETYQRLKIHDELGFQRMPEPPAKLAEIYIKNYFEHSHAALFGVVDRGWFEQTFRADLLNPTNRRSDASWYALKNVIFALGCRHELTKRASFNVACDQSWKWFENALRVHTQLLFLQATPIGIQALILMAYFTEGIGSPSLQYMLCSSAVRLAFSKGFHKQPTMNWGLTKNEACHRSWIFWAMYCLEKQIQVRTGRPPLIDDDEINCALPTWAPPGVETNVEFCTIAVRIAKLSSRVWKGISSPTVVQKTPGDVIEIMIVVGEELEALKATAPEILDGQSITSVTGLSAQQVLYLRYAFYALMLDFHSFFTHPWSYILSKISQAGCCQEQTQLSTSTVADISRQAIMLSTQLQIDANTSVLEAFVVPITAMVNLFLHILRFPTSDSVGSDLATLDVGTGYLARLELSTNQIWSCRFAKGLSRRASNYVSRVRATGLASNKEGEGLSSVFAQAGECRYGLDRFFGPTPTIYGQESLAGEPTIEDIEFWSTLFQFTEDDFEPSLNKTLDL